MDAVKDKRIRLAVLCGPTASGKTGAALDLALRRPLEIVSADSRQVCRGMDIGTAKPTAEERQRVPHHLLDIVAPGETFSAADFAALAGEAIAAIDRRGRLPLVVGGTGLYIRALTEGLIEAPGADPELRRRLHAREAEEGPGTLYRELERRDPAAARTIHPRNLVRIVRALEVLELAGRPMSILQAEHGFSAAPYRTLKIGLLPPGPVLEERIAARVDAMLEGGLVAEVEALLASPDGPPHKVLQTIGYREVVQFLGGELPRSELKAAIALHTRQYAKRQLTWFRRDKSIIWVDPSRESAKILSLIDDFMHS